MKKLLTGSLVFLILLLVSVSFDVQSQAIEGVSSDLYVTASDGVTVASYNAVLYEDVGIRYTYINTNYTNNKQEAGKQYVVVELLNYSYKPIRESTNGKYYSLYYDNTNYNRTYLYASNQHRTLSKWLHSNSLTL